METVETGLDPPLKAEMKERKKTTLHLVCIFADIG